MEALACWLTKPARSYLSARYSAKSLFIIVVVICQLMYFIILMVSLLF